MTVYSLFAAPVLGMTSQSYALNVIGVNIANVTTGGYKGSETRFSTVLSRQFDGSNDMGGVKPKAFQAINSQGLLQSSASDLHVGINGQGFFVLNSAADGSGNTFYGRDGAFEMAVGGETTAISDDGQTITVQEGYLVDKNGYFVQGLVPDANGNFDPNGQLQSLRIDQFAFANGGEATTNAEIVMNIPAGDTFGETETFGIELIDSNGVKQSAFLNFQKGDFTQTPPVDDVNLWTMTVSTDAGTSDPILLTFGQTGELVSPDSSAFNLTWASGGTASVDFDLDGLTQFDGDLVPFKFSKNGFESGQITRLQFDQDGKIIASFSDGSSRTVYQLPLAIFTNPNGLVEKNGNTYVEGPESGDRQVITASSNGFAQFVPHSRELSNVDIGQEFSNMILAQNAYNLSATTLRTVDEMTEVARDLKR